MGTSSSERDGRRLGATDSAERKRAAVETYARNEATLRRTARRYSLCDDDAEDALQRGLEILLRKAPTDDPRELIKWTQTVVKHEALAVRRERERILAGPAANATEPDKDDWVALLPAKGDGPPEQAERREAIARSREALQALKPQELRALTLLAEGYSYLEIGEMTGYSQTKVNRCLAEGRERFRRLLATSEDGSRCRAMGPLISAFCDGEAAPQQMAELREHLRACAHCRATLRAYRAAPAAAGALAPILPLHRSVWERAHDAFTELCGRLGGGKGEAATQIAVGGGGGGAGVATLAKVAIVCVGTAGGAAACVAGGLVPTPLDLPGKTERPAGEERQLSDPATPQANEAKVEYAPAPEPEQPEVDRSRHSEEPPQESAPVASEPVPVTTGGAIESAPTPEPAPIAEPAPSPTSGNGSPAGEFGP